MAYTHKNLRIEKVAVVGAGQIGPDIALHLAKVLSPFEVSVVVLDINEQALVKAKEKITAKIRKGVEKAVFRADNALQMERSLSFTLQYSNLSDAQIVIEAATEDANIKDAIFKKVESLTAAGCIFLSNSSHMQPEEIFRNVNNRTRCLVAHYFFPAELNPVVEIVPGTETDEAITRTMLSFYEDIGKIPVCVKSSFGFAIDPIFEGICQLAIMCHEQNMGSVKEIDAAAVKALGLGVGPFTALNLTGGNPITAHGLDELSARILRWFSTPSSLYRKVIDKQSWDTAQKGEIVELPEEKEKKLVPLFQGAYFALASFIIDKKIIAVDDLNMATELALVIKPPFTLMNKIGMERVRQLVKDFCDDHPAFPFPASLEKAVELGGWQLHDIVLEHRQQALLITIRRPKVMNALNLEVLEQIKSVMAQAENDPATRAVVITGFGKKAFVSGADLQMIASLKTPGDGFNNSQSFQSVLNYIAAYPKPVVCALNGFAFGGGSELAVACTARIAVNELPVAFAQPEVKLGFIPGAGGTQRLPRLIGVQKAAEILRTARNVSGAEAMQIGFLDQVAANDLKTEAIQLALDIANGTFSPKQPVARLTAENHLAPDEVEIGTLSKRIDEILVQTIYEGIKLSLPEALQLESRMFGECLKTKDMKIGLENFKINGPKVPAQFVHE